MLNLEDQPPDNFVFLVQPIPLAQLGECRWDERRECHKQAGPFCRRRIWLRDFGTKLAINIATHGSLRRRVSEAIGVL